MGKLTDALKKAAEDRLERMEKVAKIKDKGVFVAKRIGSSKIDPRVIVYFDPKALISEQYKILRTNLASLNKSNPMKVFVITSSIHEEGKSITALNLAIAVSQATRKPKVLLIDADLRRGRIAKYLGVKQKIGLSEVLQENATLDDVLFTIDIDNMAFIASGSVPPNPAELLESKNMVKLLNEVKATFDYVIIDTPPIIAVTDAGIVGSQTDGVLMVVQAGRTQRGVVKHAMELLHQTHTKILGHVLTNVQYHLPQYIYRYL